MSKLTDALLEKLLQKALTGKSSSLDADITIPGEQGKGNITINIKAKDFEVSVKSQ